MNKNDLRRKTRSKSISPSISIDQSLYTDIEKMEVDKYGAPIKEITKDIQEAIDDLFKFVNCKFYDYVIDLVVDKDNQHKAQEVSLTSFKIRFLINSSL